MRVLVVEDTDQATSLVRELGHVPLPASNCAMALDKTATWKPDLLLVDLTRVNGIELARRLRSAFRYVPLIGITDFIDIGQRKSAIDAGFDEFLPKPFRPNELVAMPKRVEARLAESAAIAERTRVIAQLTRELNRKSRDGLDGDRSF
jgi:DNA-binding response OmpR family regulator